MENETMRVVMEVAVLAVLIAFLMWLSSRNNKNE